MEVKQGYKQTELGVIPGDWRINTVNDLIDLLTDYDANGSFASVAENVKVYDTENYAWYVRSTDLENNSSLNQVKYIDRNSYLFLKKTSLNGGELLFLKRGDIGRIYLFKMRTKRATVAPNLYLLKINQKTSPTFLYYFFNTAIGQAQLKSKNASSTLGALYKDDVKSILVPIPPLQEQTAIANALRDMDALISETEKLIEKKKAIKQGAMQELLKPKEGWVTKKLGDVCEIKKGQLITESTRVNGNIPVIAGGKSPAYYHNKANRLGKTITISGSGASAGYVALHTQPIFASDCSTISESKNYKLEFIFYWLQLNQFKIYKMQTGGAQPHIHPSDLNPLEFNLPPIEQQNEIADTLYCADLEISFLELKLNKLKQQKQGMMQALLTGKIRLVS